MFNLTRPKKSVLELSTCEKLSTLTAYLH